MSGLTTGTIYAIIVFGAFFGWVFMMHNKEKKKLERDNVQTQIADLELQVQRQNAMIAGTCPQCNTPKGDSLKCTKCGYAYVDGADCYVCGNFQPKDRMGWTETGHYICKSCHTSGKGRYKVIRSGVLMYK